MAETFSASDAVEGVAPRKPSRTVNEVGWAPERARGGRPKAEPDAPEVGEPGGPSHRPGDVPSNLTRRYFTEALRGSGGVAFYEGPGAKTAAFKDHGSRLVTDQTNPAVVRDLAAIAAHRGWTAVRVKGEDEFRREMWMEARALGLTVKGYQPKERDQQELDRRLETSARRQDRSNARPDSPPARRRPERAQTASEPARSSGRERPDFDAGVSGRLVDVGEAPYRRRTGEPVTPFLRLDRGGGRMLDVWGVGIRDALQTSGAQKGDAVRVRRDGVDVVQRTVDVRDPATGVVKSQLRDVTRNRWIIEAERFRASTPGQAARDPDLRGAQSHLTVMDNVIDQAVRDPERRARLHAEARALVADELAQGRRFTPARVREIEPVLAHDVADARGKDRTPERVQQR